MSEELFLDVANAAVGHDPGRTVSSDLLYSLVHHPDRWPDLPRLETLAVGLGWTVEDIIAELGMDPSRTRRLQLADLPRLRRLLRSSLTRLEPGPLPIVAPRIRVPTMLTSRAEEWATGSLQEMVVGGPEELALDVAAAVRPGLIAARVGDGENAAYPKIPARAWLRVDGDDRDVARDRFSLIEHPNGLSCCAAEVRGRTIVLLPEPGSGYPQIELARHEVRVHGHVTAMAAQVGRRVVPRPWTVEELAMSRQPRPDGRIGVAPHPAKAMVRAAWRRRGRSYGEHDRDAPRRQRLLGKHGKQPRSTLRPYVEDSDRPPPRPDFETLFGLAAAFDLDAPALLQAFGLSPSAFARHVPDARDTPSAAIAALRTRAFGRYLEGLGWDLPWLCALLATMKANLSDVYHLGQLQPGLSPLLKPGCFLIVNPSDHTVPRRRRDPEPSNPRRDWERPLFLLSTNARPHLLCGYCERDGDTLRVHPHPDDPNQAIREFTDQVDTNLIGRVTHIATLLR